MTTGSYDSDTAGKEQLLDDGRERRPVVPYKALWARAAPRLDRELRGPHAHRARDRLDDPEQSRFHRRRVQPRHARRPRGLDVLPRLHAHPIPGRPVGRSVRAPRDDHRLAAGRVRPHVGVRPDGRPGRLRRRPRADRSRRGRLLLQRPHPDHESHAGREADARARRRDHGPVHRFDLRHHLHADHDRLGNVAGDGRRSLADAVLRVLRVHLRDPADRLHLLPCEAGRRLAARTAAPAPARLLGADLRRDRRAFPAGRDAALARVADGGGGDLDRTGLRRRHRAQRPALGPRAGPAQPQHLARLHRLHRDPLEPLVLQLLVGADREGGGA